MRIETLRLLLALLSVALMSALGLPCIANADRRPNILMIAVDDLNDWVGCLGGHPQAQTPHIDRLAKRGVLFANAHCQAPVCQPSRASLMTSRLPSSTGLYFLNPGIRQSPATKEALTLPERFAREGYTVMGGGKLFHNKLNGTVFPKIGDYADVQLARLGFGPQPKFKISQPHGHPLWDWGAYPERDDQMPDYHLAHWAADQLSRDFDQPFFLAVGFYRPHVPMHVPQKWFDRHSLSEIKLPATKRDDVDDLSEYARDLTSLRHVAPSHEWIEQSGEWRHAVQSYLASTTFVDHCVGLVVDSLERSPYRQNTIVLLFSDHGFHLGEKRRWAKRSLWEDATRVPLIVSGPGVTAGAVCDRPAGLIDVYPTLLNLCGLERDVSHEGHSLHPLLADTHREWKHAALTTFGPGNHSVRSTRWRYIRYVDGSEELYDHQSDPHEWTNVAGQDRFTDVVKDLARHLPDRERAILGSDSTGHLAYRTSNEKLAKPESPVPDDLDPGD